MFFASPSVAASVIGTKNEQSGIIGGFSPNTVGQQNVYNI
jgi:hypothetical protein